MVKEGIRMALNVWAMSDSVEVQPESVMAKEAQGGVFVPSTWKLFAVSLCTYITEKSEVRIETTLPLNPCPTTISWALPVK